MEFYIENSIPDKSMQEKNGGIGLKNLRQRLELLYRDKFSIEISKTEQKYSVLLKIETGAS